MKVTVKYTSGSVGIKSESAAKPWNDVIEIVMEDQADKLDGNKRFQEAVRQYIAAKSKGLAGKNLGRLQRDPFVWPFIDKVISEVAEDAMLAAEDAGKSEDDPEEVMNAIITAFKVGSREAKVIYKAFF